MRSWQANNITVVLWQTNQTVCYFPSLTQALTGMRINHSVYARRTSFIAKGIRHLRDHIVEDNLPIHDLVSRIEIEKRLAQHARAIDRADEMLLKTAYHDDGTVDYGSLRGTAAEFAEAIAAMHQGAPLSLHRPSNIMIKLNGDAAISESYVIAWVTLPTDGDPQPHLVGGRYLDQHRRKSGEWRMQHRHYVLDWIMQFPKSQFLGESAAFDLHGMTPTGGHYLADPGNALLMAFAADQRPMQENPTMNEADALDRVLSHQAIIELGCRYARGVDRGDAQTINSAFHDDASVVVGAFSGPAREFATSIGVMLDTHSSGVAHTVTNHWIEINGDHAVGESYVLAYRGTNGDDPQDTLTGGRYIDKYERRNGSWKIAHRAFVMDWSTASPAKDLLNLGMFADMDRGQRSAEDPVYTLWNSLNESPPAA